MVPFGFVPSPSPSSSSLKCFQASGLQEWVGGSVFAFSLTNSMMVSSILTPALTASSLNSFNTSYSWGGKKDEGVNMEGGNFSSCSLIISMAS